MSREEGEDGIQDTGNEMHRPKEIFISLRREAGSWPLLFSSKLKALLDSYLYLPKWPNSVTYNSRFPEYLMSK